MRALLSGVLTAVSLAVGAAAAPAQAAPRVVPDEVIVRFSATSSSTARTRARDAVGGTVGERLPLTGAQVLELDAGESPEEAAARLERMPGVELAEPNARYAASALPNDPAYPSQWALPVIGAPEAWDLTTGHEDVMVAVVDTGVTAQHPDLAAAVDPRGRDLVDPGTPPLDPNGHGTHVAGVIAAQRDDGFGIAGLAPRSRLLPVRVLDGRGFGDAATISEGLAYAARTGARVVNGSFGGPVSQLMHDTIESYPGVLFVFAAGNHDSAGDRSPLAPCSYELPNIVCVTATDGADRRPSWAIARHDGTDLAAPGVGILSTLPQSRSVIDDGFEAPLPGGWDRVSGWARVPRDGGGHALAADQVEGGAASVLSATIDLHGLGDCWLEYEVVRDAGALWIRFGPPGRPEAYYLDDTAGNEGVHQFELPELELTAVIGFVSDSDGVVIDDVSVRCRDEAPPSSALGELSGTSMAAPHVAGVAALAWARDLNAPVRTIRHRLLSTVEPVAALRDLTRTGGRLDAAAAVASTAHPPPPAPFRIDVVGGGGWADAFDIALLPSGGILVAEPERRVVRRVDPDGTRTVVAGGGEERGDGGPATDARLDWPRAVALLPGGGFVIADSQDKRVRRVAPDGTISTLAGGGTEAFPDAGDTGPATSAALEAPVALAVDASGAVYFTESHQGLSSRIRKVTGGVISTVAGDLDSSDRADGIPANRAWIERADHMALLPDGSVLFADRYHLRRVTPDGRVVAATDPRKGFAGDGGPFERARVGSVIDLAAAPDGTLLISDADARRVRAVSPAGIIRTIAGRGRTLSRHGGDGGPAVAADLGEPLLAPLPSGGVLVVDRTFGRVSRVVPDPTVRFTDVAPPVPAPWVEPEPEPEPEPDPTPTPTPEPDRPADQTGGTASDPEPAPSPATGTGHALAADPPTPVARPRPAVLRLLGRRRGSRFVVRRLDVRAPQGAPIRLRCSGRACPVRRASVRGRGLTRVAIRAFSRRSLAGTLTITVDVGAGAARERLVARVVRGRVRIARA